MANLSKQNHFAVKHIDGTFYNLEPVVLIHQCTSIMVKLMVACQSGEALRCRFLGLETPYPFAHNRVQFYQE